MSVIRIDTGLPPTESELMRDAILASMKEGNISMREAAKRLFDLGCYSIDQAWSIAQAA